MDLLTQAEKLNYSLQPQRHDGVLDLSKYGFMDVNFFALVQDKNPYLLKQEYGDRYIYLQIQQAYMDIIKISPPVAKKSFMAFRKNIDKIPNITFRNPYMLIVGYMASSLTKQHVSEAFAVGKKLVDVVIIDPYDILDYAMLWKRIMP